MNSADFRRKFLNEFVPTEKDQFLHELATRYHERCELYDRGVCSGMKDGIAMPVNGKELGLIGANAGTVLTSLEIEAAAKGITKAELLRAIRKAREDGR